MYIQEILTEQTGFAESALNYLQSLNPPAAASHLNAANTKWKTITIMGAARASVTLTVFSRWYVHFWSVAHPLLQASSHLV